LGTSPRGTELLFKVSTGQPVSFSLHAPHILPLVLQVMAILMSKLGTPIPAYVRTDRLLLSHKASPCSPSPSASQSSQGLQQQLSQQQDRQAADSSSWGFTLTIASVHGSECPLQMVASARVAFYDQAAVDARAAEAVKTAPIRAAAAAGAALDSAAAAAAPAQPGPVDVEGLTEVLPAQEVSGPVPWQVTCSCPEDLQDVAVVVQLQLVDAADPDKRQQQVCSCRECNQHMCMVSARLQSVIWLGWLGSHRLDHGSSGCVLLSRHVGQGAWR
jgi:hypothetical protein